MTILKRAFFWCIGLFLALISTVALLSNDLALLVKLANIMKPGVIQSQQLEGSLFSHISFDTLEYQANSFHIRITHGDIQWRFISWPHPEIVWTRIHIDTLQVITKKAILAPPSQTGSATPYKIPTLPMRCAIQSLQIKHVQVDDYLANNIVAQGSYTAERWSIPQFQAEYDKVKISLEADGQTQGTDPISIKLVARPMKGADRNAPQGAFSLAGDTSLYRWQGHLQGMAPLQSSGTIRFSNGKPFITSQVFWGPNHLKVIGEFPNKLQLNLSIPKPDLLHSSLSGLQTKILATGSFHTNQGTLTLTISPGRYQLPKDNSIPFIKFEGGELRLNLTPEALIATGKGTFDHDKTIDIDLHLPQFNLSKNLADQTIDGTINLHIHSLDFLNKITQDAENIQGQVLAALTVSGKLQHPEVQGKLTLSNAALYLPALGLRLQSIAATITSHDNQWDALGLLSAPNGAIIKIKGQGKLSPELSGEITMLGDNFPALKTEEFNITVSPQLTMHLQPDTYLITGMVTIPEAKIKLATFSKTINLTSDVVLIQDKPVNPVIPTTTKIDVQLKTGPKVFLDVQGLQGFVDGTVQVNQSPERPMYATGELAVRNGAYKAYNQDLTVRHGKLIFSGGPIANPIISLRAEKKFNQTSKLNSSDQLFDFNSTNLQTINFGQHLIVGVEVAGHLNEPKISLFSVPATLSQADILSMLVIGKPANQASGASGELLLTAMSSLNLDSGTKGAQLLSQLRENSGLDFDLKNGSQFNSNSNQNDTRTGLVVGKSLSNRLYLSYNMGLFIEDSNVLTLKYLLNKYFSLQVTASNAGNGIDLLYTNHP